MRLGMDDRPLVHVTEHIHPVADGVLKRNARVTYGMEGWSADTEALIVRNRRVSEADIHATPALRVIGKHGAGTDTIDCAAAERASVSVVATPGENAPSVAQHAIAMAFSLIRNLSGHTTALREGAPLSGQDRIGKEIDELSAGILGMGAIGSEVSRILSIFDTPRAAYDPYLPDDQWPTGVRRVSSLDEIMAFSDLLFVHMPLKADTRHLLGESAFRSMPQGAYLVNCSRGGIVDEVALADALASGRLAGAASDVFETEPPPPDHVLLRQPNFIATPHLAASTNLGLERVGRKVVQKVLSALGVDADRADKPMEEK